MTTHRYDFADVRILDSETLKVLALAVAERRNILLSGPPGSGKTMIARRLVTILPELTDLERTWIRAEYEGVGTANPSTTIAAPPFRAPHYTVSTAALVGSTAMRSDYSTRLQLAAKRGELPPGIVPRAGEAQLARFGVLFLDEIHEFSMGALTALREWLARMGATRPLLVGATAPCPCGYGLTSKCACTPQAIERWRERQAKIFELLNFTCVIDTPQYVTPDLRSAGVAPSLVASIMTSDELRRYVTAKRATFAQIGGF